MWDYQASFVNRYGNPRHRLPNNPGNAQHLVEYEKQLLQEENTNQGMSCNSLIFFAFLCLWYNFEVRKFSRFNCQIHFLRKIGVPEFERNVFVT